MAAGVTALVALGVCASVLEAGSQDRLAAAMTGPAQRLVPGGQVDQVQVTDSPALLAERSIRVQQTVVGSHGADGRPVMVIIREYDRDTRRAESVSWQITGLAMTADWRPVPPVRGDLAQVEKEIDGHRVQVRVTAVVQNDRVEVTAGGLTVDGAATTPLQAPPAVRAAVEPVLAPHAVPLPLPGSELSVTSVWFDNEGVGVELHAAPVNVGSSDVRR